MTEGRYVDNATYGFWGQGAHIKTRVDYGGYIRNVRYIDNFFNAISTQGILIETDYQSAGNCTAETCTEIRDILFSNFTALLVGGNGGGGAGQIGCFAARPCVNITLDNVHINATGGWGCNHLASGTFVNVTPPGLQKACGL
jgi:hypothetical protein